MSTLTLTDQDAEDWLDDWTQELAEDSYALLDDPTPYQALQDDECDECHLDIYEGEPVIHAGQGLVHAGCYAREGNVW